MTPTLCLATRNAHKVAEIQAIVGEAFRIISLDDIGCTEEIPETTGTIAGNSRQKALWIWERYGVNCFADDSGIEIDALGGAPGVDSAYYSGSRDAVANIAKVLQELGNNPQRAARFRAIITLVWQGEVQQFEGVVQGEILLAPAGEGGFGYDPIFKPEGYAVSMAKISSEEKNRISHRGQAVSKLLQYLRELANSGI